MPTGFFVAAALTRDGTGFVWLELILATIAMAAAYSLAVQFAEPGFALLGPAALAPYFFFATATGVLLYPEFWSVPFVIASAALFTAYLSRLDRRMLYAAVALAVVAALLRELAAYVLLVAPAAGAVYLKGRECRATLIAWGIGLLVFACGFGLHYAQAAPHISEAGGSVDQWLSGGWRHLSLALHYADEYVALKPVLPALLAVAGVVGAALVKTASQRLFLVGATAGPLLAFLVVGGSGAYLQDYWGGYWGVIAVPLALACMPIVFGELWRRTGADGVTARASRPR